MYPVNANEADLAARSVVACAQADDFMRLIRENQHDMALTLRLHAQYASMARTSAAAQASLLRVPAVRRQTHNKKRPKPHWSPRLCRTRTRGSAKTSQNMI